ncbi:hypothetical protein COJ48_06215 [Bacillus cereus]|nr:hypothetical protein COJ48_06215 [Bacillus cereus]PGP76748.1 hypothetical protein CN997_24105 [Bacillus cereus]
MEIQAAESNGETKMKYRLGYDRVFLPRESFSYKGDLIGSTSIGILFKIFDDKGNEKLFDLEEPTLNLKNGESCYVSHLIDCYFDRDTILKIEPDVRLLKESGYASVQWEIVDYTKDIDKGIFEPEMISEEEFMDIMKTHIDLFDVSDNYPAQNTSYFTREVKC